MRGFVFSLDAFVAFTLALVAVYSLIFFSSVPSSYYYLLTQGHYLARDALWSTSTTMCADGPYLCGDISGSVLDAIASLENEGQRKTLIQDTVGNVIPEQFGYTLEVSEDQGNTWRTFYNSSDESGDTHVPDSVTKLKVSSQIINFGYTGKYRKLEESPYKYLTCGSATSGIVITCGEYNLIDPDAAGDIVPMPKAKLVKLTVFI
jgi:hypothetical protein